MEHEALYNLPEIYEIAFSYRDIPRECDFLTSVYASLVGRVPHSVLELACGPGTHVREFHRRGLSVAALDLSPAMVRHVVEQLGDISAEVVSCDMAHFSLSRRVDLACTMIDSLSYLTQNENLLSHLKSVHNAVVPGGVYVIELRHPRDVWFGGDKTSTINTWTMERDGIRVTTEWGVEVKPDPIRQIERVLTRISVESKGDLQVIESWGELRPWLPQELLAMVSFAGGWRFAGWWGDFDLHRPLGDSEADWRMIVALQSV